MVADEQQEALSARPPVQSNWVLGKREQDHAAFTPPAPGGSACDPIVVDGNGDDDDHQPHDDGVPVGYMDVCGEGATERHLSNLLKFCAVAGPVVHGLSRLIAERESAICVTTPIPNKPIGHEAAMRNAVNHGVPSAKTLAGAAFIVAIAHDGKFHWTSVVVHVPTLSAVVYDSSASLQQDSEAAGRTVRRVLNEAQALCALRDVKPNWMGQSFEVRRMLAPRQQADSLDCGVCAVLGLEAILAAYKGLAYEFETGPDWMLTARVAMYRALTDGSVAGDCWPPVSHIRVRRGH